MLKLILVLTFVFTFVTANIDHIGYEPLPIEKLNLPKGFKIEVLARVGNARQMSLSPKGIIFVGSFRSAQGVVTALVPIGNGKYESFAIAKGLKMPTGLTFHKGSLYVGAIDQILRFDNIEQRIRNPPTPIVVTTFPSDVHHGWKYIKVHKDKMYVPVGAPCNICNSTQVYATIWKMDLDGKNKQVIAKGVRNTVGFDWDPETGDFWFTENGRDMLGDDTPPDELNHLKKEGDHYGFPFCHGKNISDPQFNPSGKCDQYKPATYELGPHVAALGLTFYQGKKFPKKYQNQPIFAEHGSWNRRIPIGYRVMMVDKKNPSKDSYKVFIDGWLQLPAKDSKYAWGRPTDVLNMPDGSLLISDDKGNAVYKVTYEG